MSDIKQGLKDKGHGVTNIWNVKQRVTNKHLPIQLIDIKPNGNNKEIYKVNTLLKTIVQFEAPHTKREIPQCMCCQKFGHMKNYCRNNPRCVKCAAHNLTTDCPRKVKDDNFKCVNCNENHPANYRGCMVHKQTKNVPQIKGTTHSNRTNSYAQVVQGQTETPQTNVVHPHPTKMTQPANDLREFKQIKKK
jgi:hypothetical protein